MIAVRSGFRSAAGASANRTRKFRYSLNVLSNRAGCFFLMKQIKTNWPRSLDTVTARISSVGFAACYPPTIYIATCDESHQRDINWHVLC